MRNKFKFLCLTLFVLLFTACNSNSNINNSSGKMDLLKAGGGVISGEPVNFEIMKTCELFSIDPTFDESGEIQFLYERILDSYTVLVTLNDGSYKNYFPAIKVFNGTTETYKLYRYHDTPGQKLLGLVELSLNTNFLTSYSLDIQDFQIQNCQ